MTQEIANKPIQKLDSTKQADLLHVEGEATLIIQATKNFIPLRSFKDIFYKATEIIKDKGITKIIFDKRKLKIFHQPSMLWYFTDWKEEMVEQGVKTHRKLLPSSPVFQESVKRCREQIIRDYPDLKVHQLDIQYCDSLEEAIQK